MVTTPTHRIAHHVDARQLAELCAVAMMIVASASVVVGFLLDGKITCFAHAFITGAVSAFELVAENLLPVGQLGLLAGADHESRVGVPICCSLYKCSESVPMDHVANNIQP